MRGASSATRHVAAAVDGTRTLIVMPMRVLPYLASTEGGGPSTVPPPPADWPSEHGARRLLLVRECGSPQGSVSLGLSSLSSRFVDLPEEDGCGSGERGDREADPGDPAPERRGRPA